jgi:hypothetical protein
MSLFSKLRRRMLVSPGAQSCIIVLAISNGALPGRRPKGELSQNEEDTCDQT